MDKNMQIDNLMESKNYEALWDIICDSTSTEEIKRIVDYYITNRADFHVCETLSYDNPYIDEDYIIKKVLDTRDLEFIYRVSINGTIQGTIKETNIKHLKDFCKNNYTIGVKES